MGLGAGGSKRELAKRISAHLTVTATATATTTAEPEPCDCVVAAEVECDGEGEKLTDVAATLQAEIEGCYASLGVYPASSTPDAVFV